MYSFIPSRRDCCGNNQQSWGWGAGLVLGLRPCSEGDTTGSTDRAGSGEGCCSFLRASPDRNQGQSHAAHSVPLSTSHPPLPG